MSTSDQTTPGGGGQGERDQGQAQGFALDPSAAPSTQAPGPPGETAGTDQPTEPTATPGPTVQSTDTRPSDAPMPGTGPTQNVDAPAPAPAADDPNENAVLIDASERGLTFRRSADAGGGLVTMEVRLRGGNLAVGAPGSFDRED